MSKAIIDALKKHPDGLTAQELEAETGLSRGHIHRTLADRKKRGIYIDRWETCICGCKRPVYAAGYHDDWKVMSVKETIASALKEHGPMSAGKIAEVANMKYNSVMYSLNANPATFTPDEYVLVGLRQKVVKWKLK